LADKAEKPSPGAGGSTSAAQNRPHLEGCRDLMRYAVRQRYFSSSNWPYGNTDQNYHPDWNITQGTSLANPQECQEWITRAIPPAALAISQEQPTQNLSNASACALAMLCVNFVETCRRGDLDMARTQAAESDKKKAMFELNKQSL
jgi:hypothetical protein